MSAEAEHPPRRPGFDCASCGQPWPCAPAKVLLCEEYVGNRPALFVYLAGYLSDAINDSYSGFGPQPAKLYDRMIGWARVAPRPCQPPTTSGVVRARRVA